jgi:pimeloyl-ACP methyl ester carboxylesterase
MMARSATAKRQASPTVLLLTGVGLTAAVGLRIAAELRADFRVLAAPAGDAAEGQVLAEASVDGATALLDAAGVDQAHIVGLSFGGVIAQELAIRDPRRVRSLVLGATSAGGALSVPPEAPIRAFLRGLGDLPVEERLWGAVPYVYAPRTRHRHAPLIGQDIARRLRHPLDPSALRRQQATAQAHDAVARLARISAPTLVVHGEEDRLVPVDNGRRLAAAIGGAQLVTLPHGAHAFPTDVPDANRELVSFLLAHSRPRPRSPAGRNARAARA